ncbi:chemosensory receptor A [Elysia marginata]|uniref:Chemosensory receptor A n=1 Tax=Elysia marginata TaxID=1093978 RepID=A0AAV4EPK4_9GAST|nr:chemosensory receptor A [Elysia marginata]
MLTPGRSLAVIVSIFLAMFAVVSPVFFASPLGWKFSPKRNRTLYMQLGVDNEVEQITYGLSNVCGYVAFFVVILCTAILITSLRRKAKWREGVTGTGTSVKDSDDLAASKSGSGGVSKEMKIIKLVVIISTVFIGSYFPSTVVFLAATAMPGFSATGKYHNLFFMACSLTYNLEAINSSVNIFIYLNMSSKYKATFDAMFCRGETSSLIAGKD